MEVFARRPRKPFLGLALSALLGITLADWISLPAPALVAAILVTGSCAIVWPMRSLCWATALLSFSLLHTVRHVENPARSYGASLGEPRTAIVEGVVWSEPASFVSTRGQAGGTFWLRIETIEPSAPVAEQLCLIRWHGEMPKYGDRARIRGTLQPIDAPRNPGQFNVARWLCRQGVHFEVEGLDPRDCEVIGHDGGDPLRRFAAQSSGWIREKLNAGAPNDPEIAALINSMVLGLRGDTPPELKELFQKTGTLHLFAVSGLNVAMLVVIAWYGLKPFGFRQKSGALIIIPLLAAYAVIVGMSASCVRATVVAAFLLAGPIWERETIPLNSLAAAAFAILVWDTNELFNPGFQLSFVLVLVIMALSRRIQEPVQRWSEPDDFIPQRLWNAWQRGRVWAFRIFAGSVAVGVAAWVGSLVFMWGYFHLVSPIALLANLLAVPLAFCILAMGLLSLVLGFFQLSAPAIAVNHANWFCAKALVVTVDQFAQVPKGHVYVEWPRLERKVAAEVVLLDAREGAAIHIRSGANDWLIDAGHQRDYERMLLPYLRSRGVDRLAGLWLTHGDTAHMGGAPRLVEDFQPLWVGETAASDRSSTRRAFHAELVARSAGRRFYWRGDRVALGGGAAARVLFPPADLPPQNLADDKALVLQLEANGRKILFASDIGFSAEVWLLKHEPDLQSDILVKGWADRDLSGTPDFIKAVAPSAIVCAAQKFGADGAKFEEWAAPLRDRGIIVLSQAQCGAARITIDRDGGLELAPWRADYPLRKRAR